MPGLFHTVELPVRPAASRALAWPPQDPTTVRTCELDCARWCADGGRTIASVIVLVDPSMIGGGVVWTTTSVRVVLRGGIVGTDAPVALTLLLDNGDRENVVVAVPVRSLIPAIPAGAVTIGSQPIVLAGVPIDVAAMSLLPGGAAAGDVALVYRPGVPGLVAKQPLTLLGGAGGSAALVSAMTAGAAVSGHRAVMLTTPGTVVHAEPSLAGYVLAGITMEAATIGAAVSVCEAGVVIEPSWAWTTGASIFAGPGGVLTATPPAAGVLHQVAVATGPTAILVRLYPPITLA